VEILVELSHTLDLKRRVRVQERFLVAIGSLEVGVDQSLHQKVYAGSQSCYDRRMLALTPHRTAMRTTLGELIAAAYTLFPKKVAAFYVRDLMRRGAIRKLA
jgi:hypothetical protein